MSIQNPKSKIQNHLPFFVYGTLLPGDVNYYYWGDSIVRSRPGILLNGQLYDMGYYPMLVEGDNSIKGQVMDVEPAQYEAVMARLDKLEGYDPAGAEDSLYRRITTQITLQNGQTITAWVYLGHASYTIGRPPIPHGDWLRYAQEKQASIQAWWQAGGHVPTPEQMNDN